MELTVNWGEMRMLHSPCKIQEVHPWVVVLHRDRGDAPVESDPVGVISWVKCGDQSDPDQR